MNVLNFNRISDSYPSPVLIVRALRLVTLRNLHSLKLFGTGKRRMRFDARIPRRDFLNKLRREIEARLRRVVARSSQIRCNSRVGRCISVFTTRRLLAPRTSLSNDPPFPLPSSRCRGVIVISPTLLSKTISPARRPFSFPAPGEYAHSAYRYIHVRERGEARTYGIRLPHKRLIYRYVGVRTRSG